VNLARSRTSDLYTIALLGAVVFLIYSNTFNVPWHFDDFENIVFNQPLHLTEWAPDPLATFARTVWVDGWRNRPLAYSSFALNWYIGQDRTTGYHLANTAVHWLAAVFLFLANRQLFRTPRLAGTLSARQIQLTCAVAALLWAVHPIQTQAVTYIVQRMAAMSGMFFILTVWLFLCGRLCADGKQRIWWFAGCAAGFAAAFLSKENAATLPLALLLVDAVFFRDLRRGKTALLMAAVVASMMLAGLWLSGRLFFGGDIANVLSYGDRHFTAWERVLSQPRALVLYLSLIAYPSPLRLSVVHDFAASAFLWSPWTTGVCLMFVAGLAAAAFRQIRVWPLASFGLLFFLVNHMVESSIIGLELVFEHRNYLPSMFLFLSPAAWLLRAAEAGRGRGRLTAGAPWAVLFVMVVGFGSSAYIRNMAWASPQLLWEDALSKAPGESRPYQMLAVHHYDRMGDRETALRLYTAALAKRRNRISDEAVIYNNMAAHFYRGREYERAAELWRLAAETYPGYQFTRFRLAEALLRSGRPEEALAELDRLIADNPGRSNPPALKGVILVLQGRPIEGLDYLRRSIRAGARDPELMLNVGAALHRLGLDSQAQLYFHEARRAAPAGRLALLWLACSHLQAGVPIEAERYLAMLASVAPVFDAADWARTVGKSRITDEGVIAPPVDDALLAALAGLATEVPVEADPRPLRLGGLIP
jgi:tetratricopeptide (TPR) repeat protein